MVWVYFDASALAKRYAAEPGTPAVNELFRLVPAGKMQCSLLGMLEIISILVRKRNDGRLSPELYAQASADLDDEIMKRKVVELTSVDDALVRTAASMILKHNLNATDAVVLHSALQSRQIIAASAENCFLCAADKRLNRAAQLEGIATLDPEIETEQSLKRLLGV